jgi:hypothetical protein
MIMTPTTMLAEAALKTSVSGNALRIRGVMNVRAK